MAREAQSNEVTGIWKNSFYDTETQQWKSRGWHVVTQRDGSYSMAPVDYASSLRTPVDITQIDVSGDAWNFVENQDDFNDGVHQHVYRLNRAGPNRYEGKVYAHCVNDSFYIRFERFTSKAQQAKELRSVLNQLRVEKKICEQRIPMLEGNMNVLRRPGQEVVRPLPE